jgi:hypothetical protein
MVLAADYRIVEIGSRVEAGFGVLEGLSLWEAFPGAEPLFQPYYEKAWRTGEPVEFVQYYNGYIMRINAVPEGERLLLFWEVLCRLDTLTLEGLWASLIGAMEIVEECEDRVGRERIRGLLQLIEGEGR